MAHKLRDGFDFYGTTAEAANGIWTSLGTATLSSSTRFSAGQSVSTPTTLNQVGFSGAWSPTTNTMWITFAHVQTAALAGGTATQTLRFYDGATVTFSIRFFDNGSINFYRGNAATLLGTYAGAFGGSARWAQFQIKVIISTTVGEFHVRKNGGTVDDYALTAVNNSAAGTAVCSGMDIICATSASAVQLWDDIWFYDNQNAGDGSPFDWIGDVRAVQVMPTADVFANFSRSTGATNYTLVDELINSNTDYVFANVPTTYDEYSSPGLATTPLTIFGLTAKCMAYKTDAAPRTANMRLNSASIAVIGPPQAPGALVANVQAIYFNQDLDPATSGPWSQAGIAALKFGPAIIS